MTHRDLRPPWWLQPVLWSYCLIQTAFVFFTMLPDSPRLLIYGFALVAKLLLHGHVAGLIWTGRLHTYDGRAASRR